ncbi:Hypothetical protein, putative [Bodo saltans]|uniref:Uncharacterized protein n=1 Tax=Bodo saltans TaxID=75058 RepID=A0A0S4JGS1_BODSA|nr:Hypothetical protein, putative [Bodo saltans]|eukprot:CUG88189.1 Hypothetical protein, putative [Bodo saltans]
MSFGCFSPRNTHFFLKKKKHTKRFSIRPNNALYCARICRAVLECWCLCSGARALMKAIDVADDILVIIDGFCEVSDVMYFLLAEDCHGAAMTTETIRVLRRNYYRFFLKLCTRKSSLFSKNGNFFVLSHRLMASGVVFDQR